MKMGLAGTTNWEVIGRRTAVMYAVGIRILRKVEGIRTTQKTARRRLHATKAILRGVHFFDLNFAMVIFGSNEVSSEVTE